ncbi:hypothetical protein Tco_0906532 [Tanacetum coccineum]|uniref:Uncharacterized protein n=1 Tax=Tanacetum coccineum TaxID=301880 RepID=A0ABQ5CI86_9ASTR
MEAKTSDQDDVTFVTQSCARSHTKIFHLDDDLCPQSSIVSDSDVAGPPCCNPIQHVLTQYKDKDPTFRPLAKCSPPDTDAYAKLFLVIAFFDMVPQSPF